MMHAEVLVEKIKGLPPSYQSEVEDFVDFLALKDDRNSAVQAMKTSEKAFERVWDNDEDAVYDEL